MAEEVDLMFEDAVDALRQGDQARAKDILTRLLKANQKNATYWIWMSAAVDTTKERIYCLETALKLEPENTTAKRGLVLLGGLPPDENVQPFPLNHPRAWEENLLLAHEKPKERGLKVVLSSPVTRLAGVGLLGVLVCGLAFFGFFNPRTAQFRLVALGTAGPSPTFTLTPTYVNATGIAVSTQRGPTPLAALMGVSYTPTPLYVNTPRLPISQDIYQSARYALQQGNWDEYIRQMQQIQKVEPTAADIPYYIGEAYRAQGDCRSALQAYNDSLKINKAFAPGYLGLARARLCIDPGADTTALYDLAIQSDPFYGDPYLERANYNLVHKDFSAALPDLEKAGQIMPDSALVQLGFAQAYMLQGDYTKALTTAQKANSIDLTLLPSYYYLGSAYIANNQFDQAIKPLQTYLIYQTKDGGAYALLGQAYTQTGDYKSAIDALGKALALDPNQLRAYIYLGTSNLRLDNLDDAKNYFQKALEYFPNSFDANIGLTETMYKQGTFGSAYLQSETAKSKATNQTQLALAIYWRALSQEGRKDIGDAIADWKTLLSMPEGFMTPEMRQTAEDHLKKLVPPTATPKGGVKTATPTASAAPSRTPKPSGSVTLTPTPTSTKKP